MSFYTRFADTESLITSSTTTIVGATDNLLVFSNTDKKYYKTTISGVGLSGGAFSTSTSSAAPIPALPGNVVITSATSNAGIAVQMLSTPAQAGIAINFFNSSSTSTFNTVQSESTSVNFFMPGATAGGGATMQFTCSYQSFGIVSGFSTTGAVGVSTSASWFVTYKSTGVYSS